jgi:phosphoribosylaminoimidazole-succinocarboxamide synthase
MHHVLASTADLGLKPDRAGKVRDVFDLGDRLLIVSTDRLSAYDVILPTRLPGKGVLLTQITLGWYEHFGASLHTHFLTAEVSEYPAPFRHRQELAGRSMMVAKAERFDIECVVRGYLSGSGWKEYQRSQSVCGIRLPAGLTESAALPEPIFTPATKADTGHDENISFEQMCAVVPRAQAEELRRLSIDLYRRGRDYARSRGIILADTKFEFGMVGGRVTLIDEMLTPDSSRFWPADRYAPGRPQESFDKQFVRDYLDRSGWDHNPPGPELPGEVVAKTIGRYREAHDRLFPHRNLERYL